MDFICWAATLKKKLLRQATTVLLFLAAVLTVKRFQTLCFPLQGSRLADWHDSIEYIIIFMDSSLLTHFITTYSKK